MSGGLGEIEDEGVEGVGGVAEPRLFEHGVEFENALDEAAELGRLSGGFDEHGAGHDDAVAVDAGIFLDEADLAGEHECAGLEAAGEIVARRTDAEVEPKGGFVAGDRIGVENGVVGGTVGGGDEGTVGSAFGERVGRGDLATGPGLGFGAEVAGDDGDPLKGLDAAVAGADVEGGGGELGGADVLGVGEEVFKVVETFLVTADAFVDQGVADGGAAKEFVPGAAGLGVVKKMIQAQRGGEAGEQNHHEPKLSAQEVFPGSGVGFHGRNFQCASMLRALWFARLFFGGSGQNETRSGEGAGFVVRWAPSSPASLPRLLRGRRQGGRGGGL